MYVYNIHIYTNRSLPIPTSPAVRRGGPFSPSRIVRTPVTVRTIIVPTPDDDDDVSLYKKLQLEGVPKSTILYTLPYRLAKKE
jgi:hypothetical protein